MNPPRGDPRSTSSALSGRSQSQDRQRVYVSGEWEIDCGRRELRARGTAVPIGSRAFEIIEVLVQSSGKLVTTDELMGGVWSGTVVEDNTLRVHIVAIRKALGADRDMLKTVQGRGYRLLGTWTIQEERTVPERHRPERPQAAARPFLTNVPVAASALIGREAVVQHLRDLLSAYRVVTLTGPGGIGKTVLVAEVARRLFPTLESDVLLVELVSLSDPDLVPAAVMNALGLQLGGDEISAEAVARAIGSKKLLLVLDNCEHVIEAAASLAETVVRLCPRTTILTTSREALRIDGECLYHVPPLDVPHRDQDETTGILQHSAVQLFVARAKALRADLSAGDENVLKIAAICRRLDGIPLALEFAAARAASLGVKQVADRLDDRFGLLTGGRRTALPRHQTLRAALDWSYELLPESEQRLLCHLAIFPAGFTLEAAAAVLSGRVSEVATGISNLVSKSLVTLGGSSSVRHWRLLETIRAYALEKLDASGEREHATRRHAEYYGNLFARAETEALARPTGEWLAVYGWEIDNLRSALDWAFSPDGGDTSVGVSLTAAAVPLWVYLSHIAECRSCVERALKAFAAAASADARVEMKLQAALGASLTWIGGAVTETKSVWTRTLGLAESLGSVDYQLRALWGLWLISDRGALELAQRFGAVASTPTDQRISDQMIGYSYHFQGNQSSARRHLERVIANKDAAADRIDRFHLDQHPSGILARVLWLQGLPDHVMAMAERLVEDAKKRDHANSLCYALGTAACPIALWAGNLDLAEQYIDLLSETSRRHELTLWQAIGRAHRSVLLIKHGDLKVGLPQARAAFEECRAMPAGYRFGFIAELPEALAPGQDSGGLARIDEAIDRAERTTEGWIIPELLRAKGELCRLGGAAGAADVAEDCFRQALQLARTQGALSWELRAAIGLAQLWVQKDRPEEARRTLAPVYHRFTEGFETADLRSARAILNAMPGV